MATDVERADNQAAYRRLKHEIDEKYPLNRFVAIDKWQIVADTDTLDAMLLKLAALGWNPRDVMVVQAGVFEPDEVFIVL
jgi:hypothetical protein